MVFIHKHSGRCRLTATAVYPWSAMLLTIIFAMTMVMIHSIAGGSSVDEILPGGAKRHRDCMIISGKRDIVVENVKIGPCRGPGILISESSNVTIRNVTIVEVAGVGIGIFRSQNVKVSDSTFHRGQSGVYVEKSENIEVGHNRFFDVQGPKPRGQFVQFNQVTGVSRIFCNEGRNALNNSVPEDAISIYKSKGTRQVPILVDHNLIVGGGPSRSGGGIMLGDGGGAWTIARGNRLIDPGQYGIAVAGGSHMVIENNSVFARRQDFTNVGIYVWNQYRSVCRNVTVRGNVVNWTSKANKPNSWWNGKNCDDIAFESANYWNAPLASDSINILPTYCSARRENVKNAS